MMVRRRWAMTRRVLSLNSLRMVDWMRESVAKSTEAVASLQRRRKARRSVKREYS